MRTEIFVTDYGLPDRKLPRTVWHMTPDHFRLLILVRSDHAPACHTFTGRDVNLQPFSVRVMNFSRRHGPWFDRFIAERRLIIVVPAHIMSVVLVFLSTAYYILLSLD